MSVMVIIIIVKVMMFIMKLIFIKDKLIKVGSKVLKVFSFIMLFKIVIIKVVKGNSSKVLSKGIEIFLNVSNGYKLEMDVVFFNLE